MAIGQLCFALLVFALFANVSSQERTFRRLTLEESDALQESCGIPFITDENRSSVFLISFGKKPKQGELPWAAQVLVHSRDEDGRSFSWRCSASVISKYHVITAAHCLDFKDSGFVDYNIEEDYVVLAGSPCSFDEENDSIRFEDCRSREVKLRRRLSVKQIIVPQTSLWLFEHKDEYFSDHVPKNESDYAILELRNPLNESDPDIRPICFANPKTGIADHLHAYGFGEIRSGYKNTKRNLQLYKLEIREDQILSVNQCLSSGLRKPALCHAMISIAFDSRLPTSVCSGDSGGGLSGVVRGKHFLFGIISRAASYCDYPKHYGIKPYYFLSTRISSHIDFICFYTGICPLGYNTYENEGYERHPEPAVFLSKGNAEPITRGHLQRCNQGKPNENQKVHNDAAMEDRNIMSSRILERTEYH